MRINAAMKANHPFPYLFGGTRAKRTAHGIVKKW
jgi:hypothetical protein